MAGPFADRVSETVSTTGTGSITTSSNAATSFVNWSSLVSGSSYYYLLTSGNGTDWEVGLTTVTVSGSNATLTRSTVTASSNSGNAINLSGTSTISSDVPAQFLNAASGIFPGGLQTNRWYPPTYLAGAAITTGGSVLTGYVSCHAIYIGPESAPIKSFGIYWNSAPSTAYQWEAAIYADSGVGSPGALLAGTDTGVVSSGVASGVNSFVLPTPVSWPTPGIYWIAIRFVLGVGAGGGILHLGNGTSLSLDNALQGVQNISNGMRALGNQYGFNGWIANNVNAPYPAQFASIGGAQVNTSQMTHFAAIGT